jgi:hypothetical protein
MNKKLLIGSVLGILTLGAFGAAPASAFHGSMWHGFGTAVKADGTVYNLDFLWGGQDAVIDCAGGGCRGVGDGRVILRDQAGNIAGSYPYYGIEDVRNILFTSDPVDCPNTGWDSYEITPNYLLTYAFGTVSGIQRNCLTTGINHNDFTGTFQDYSLTIHAEGTFGVAHG